MSDALGPDALILTLTIATPELREACAVFCAAIEALDGAQGPTRGGGVRTSGKPGSRPPSGNLEAARLARRVAHYVETPHGGRQLVGTYDFVPSAVRRLYAELDPDERAEAKEQRKTLKAERERTARADALKIPNPAGIAVGRRALKARLAEASER